MTISLDLLIEIGSEELPPRSLRRLATAFAGGIETGLEQHNLNYGKCQWFATPRRMAVLVSDLVSAQADREVQRRGPALSAAYDDDGKPTSAAEGFARSCGVKVSDLKTLENDRGAWLVYDTIEEGKQTTELLQEIIDGSLAGLPIPRRMRWGNNDTEFVRPVHWAVVLFDEEIVECSVLGITAGNLTYGHRVHHPHAIKLSRPGDYQKLLKKTGFVIPEFGERKEQIEEAIINAAKVCGGHHLIEDDLLNEVTSLVEWPVAVTGSFEKRFLELPHEVLIATMQSQQKYFPVLAPATKKKGEKEKPGKLLSYFITIANLDSKDPEQVRKGNERVIGPRLSDAEFFWRRDRAKPLVEYGNGLKEVVFQKQLGTLYDRTKRLEKLAAFIASEMDIEHETVIRAAVLSKCDLLTEMVGEFPELQGTMGRYYALAGNEPEIVADAINEQYMPRHSGAELPQSTAGRVLAIADKLDILMGIFAIGQPPTGDKDPYGLRRAAVGSLRIMIECELDLNLEACLMFSAGTFSKNIKTDAVVGDVFDFMMERLRRYYLDEGTAHDVFDSVLARRPVNPYDFHRRIMAVTNFTALPESESLAAANKRIQNILRQAGNGDADDIMPGIDTSLLSEVSELELARQLEEIAVRIKPLVSERNYSDALIILSRLRDSVDIFFDNVMVMVDDEKLRMARLQLLAEIRHEFHQIADISRLQVQQP